MHGYCKKKFCLGLSWELKVYCLWNHSSVVGTNFSSLVCCKLYWYYTQINYVLLSNGKWKKAQGPEAFLPLQSHLSFHLYVFHSPVIFLALVKLHPLAFCFHFQPKKYSKNFKFVFNFVPFDCVFLWGEGGRGVCVGERAHFNLSENSLFKTNFKVMVSTKALPSKGKEPESTKIPNMQTLSVTSKWQLFSKLSFLLSFLG